MTQNALRAAYEAIDFTKSFCREHDVPFKKMGDFITYQRSKIHQVNRYIVDPLEKSMREGWRHICSEDGESGYDYRIIPDNGQTEEEIEDQVCCEVGYPPIYSPYDCTGKRFTRWIKVRRAPAGFAVIHSWGLDV